MLITLAGNIGVGKSSVTSLLHEFYGWKPLFEPLMDNPYISDFYAHKEQWAYQSELYFLSQQCNALERVPPGKEIAVQARSVYEDAEIFAAYLYQKGYFKQHDYETYSTFYRGVTRVFSPPKVIIYLRADTDVLIENIRLRGREYERSLPRQYIQDLNERYDAWAKAFNRCPLHTVDVGEMELLNTTQQQEELVYTIRRLAH